MTNAQKERIIQRHASGERYTQIAAALGLSENTVKSFGRRNALGTMSTDGHINIGAAPCAQCGKLMRESNQKTRRFCSDRCRLSWWKIHPESLNRKAVYHFACTQCGSPFDSYGNNRRKYCSRACYAKAKTTVIRAMEVCP